MEIIISPSLNKIKKEERIKTPFFYAINNFKKDYKFFRVNTVEVSNMFENTKKVYVSKLDDIITKNCGNIYNLDTETISGFSDSVIEDEGRSRSLDFYYYYFLGYYELKNNQKNYIRFLQEYLQFYFEYIKQSINFFTSQRFKSHFEFDEDKNRLKYLVNNYYVPRYAIQIPCLLKCPDIGKVVMSASSYYVTGGPAYDYYYIEKFLDFNKNKIKECFKSENLDNFFNIKALDNRIIDKTTSEYIINFASSYRYSNKIIKENRNYLEKDEDEYFDEDEDDGFPISNKYGEECLDEYYFLFKEKYSLKELFEIALKQLIKSGYSF